MWTLLSLYIAALVFGGGLLALSLVVGHDDAGGADSADNDAAHGGVDHADHTVFFSLRFWTFLLGFGGATGLLLTLLSIPAGITAAVAGALGVAFGFIASWSVRTLSRSQHSSAFGMADWEGRSARVTVPVSAGRMGKIRLELEDEVKEVLARANAADGELPVGTDVIVAGMENGVALVTPNRIEGDARSKAVSRPETH